MRLRERECEHVGHLSIELLSRRSESVAARKIDPQQHRLAGAACRLQPCRHLAGLPWIYARIVYARREKYRRISNAIPYVLVGVHRVEPFEPILGLH